MAPFFLGWLAPGPYATGCPEQLEPLAALEDHCAQRYPRRKSKTASRPFGLGHSP